MRLNNCIAGLISMLILCSCNLNKQTVMKESDLILKFNVADSLFLSGNKIDLEIYTRKELVPIFNYYSYYRKAIILNYLVENKDKENILLAKKIISKNYHSINKCDLVSEELMQYFNLISSCKIKDSDVSKIDWDNIYESDQQYRNIINNYSPDTKEWDSLSILLFNQDKSNRTKISDYINTIGLKKIAENDCNCKAIKTIFFVGLHSDDDKFRSLIIKNFSDKNFKNVSPKYLTYLIDRKLVLEKKKQIYGTQMKFNKLSSKFEPSPMDNSENIDHLRFQNNLPALKHYIELVNKTN